MQVIMLVPAETPETIPVVAPTVATGSVLLDQATPGVADARVVVAPTQTDNEPVIAAGKGNTVTTVVVMQPDVGNV
jgi:hypothetical protein